MRKPLAMTAIALCAFVVATSSAQARPNSATRSTWQSQAVHFLRHKIGWNRSMAWHYQDIAGVARTYSERAEQRTTSVPFLRWERHLWVHRRVIARRLASRRSHARSLASYSSGSTGWDRVASCESGGNWSLVTGNGFYWGLQWVPSTWDSRARTLGLPSWSWFVSHHTAPSRAMQIRAATGMSLSNWPVCGARY